MMSFEDFKNQLEEEVNNDEEAVKRLNDTNSAQKSNRIEINNFNDLYNIVTNYLKNNEIKLLIGTPCYGGLVHSGYFQSMLELTSNLTKLNINYEVINVGNESLITRARNGIVAKFLSDDFTHLMFIDADITFPWLGIIRLLLSEKDLCGGCYPKKNINWDKVKRNLIKNKDINNKELIAKSVDYVFNPVYFKEGDNTVARLDNGLVQVKDVATGFMLIRKNVFTTLKYKFPELKYKNNVAGYHNDKTKDNFYTFFDTVIDPESRVYLSEDYYFCDLWRKCGGDLWIDLNTNLNHCGTFDYIGCLAMNINQNDDLNQDTIVTQNTIH